MTRRGEQLSFLERLLTVCINSSVTCLPAFFEAGRPSHSYIFFRVVGVSSVPNFLEIVSSLQDEAALILDVFRHFVKVLSEDYVIPDFFKRRPIVMKSFVKHVRQWVTDFVSALVEQKTKLAVPLPLRVEIQDIDQNLSDQIRKLI